MRQIKFRGYNRKNGTWMYGFYLQNRGGHYVCPDEFANGKSWDDYEINFDTLGQFTGLYDKNGKEIYEGDILKVDFLSHETEVEYVIDGFMACRKNYPNESLCYVHKECEVIGNIHDNHSK